MWYRICFKIIKNSSLIYLYTEPKNEEITCSFLVPHIEPKPKQKLVAKKQKHDLKQSKIPREVIFVFHPNALKTKTEKIIKIRHTNKKTTRLNTKTLSSAA